MKLRAKLGVAAAVLTMVVALMVPFVMYGLIAKGVARLGLHVDEIYSGGPTVRTIQHQAYSINVHSALPEHVADTVDIDGDGQPDLLVSFNAPKDPKAELRVDVDPLDGRFESMKNAGKDHYSRLIVRVDDAILVRVPVPQR